MERKNFNWLWAWQAVIYGLGMVILSGLIPAWGQWYSQSIHYRRQGEALLHGSLAMSTNPADLALDLAWAESGVHQVWGLGVPLWRLPFEAAARVVGEDGFPDMLALAVALALAAWLVLRAVWSVCAEPEPTTPPGASKPAASPWKGVCLAAGGAMLLLLFPPFLNLLRSRFDIYEEAVAYEYVYGLVLIAALLRLAHAPAPGRLWTMCALAGLGGLVRPTLLFHGAAAVAAGVWTVWMARKRSSGKGTGNSERGELLKTLAVGAGLFVLGGLVLFATNRARFGSGFEFGHKLNVQTLYGSLYATRFDDPFKEEPVFSSALELFGLLFLPADLERGGTFYEKKLFWGQSPTVRWREVYLTAYDWSYLVLLACGWAAAGREVWRGWRGQGCPGVANDASGARLRVVSVLGLYSAGASAVLVVFFLRNAVISSRYLLDLMPAFAAAMLAGWLALGTGGSRRRGALLSALAGLALCGWIAWQIPRGHSAYGPPRPRTWPQVAEQIQRRSAAVVLPRDGVYDVVHAPDKTGIPYNGAGWGDSLKPCVILFVDDPAFLELELAPTNESDKAAADGPQALRVKVGLEILEREFIRRTERGWMARFAGPRRSQYQHGLHPVFLATVPNAQLSDDSTPWRLLRARWKGETK